MAWQLIYTSAPRGLVAGRSGFCTVARHREIRDGLVTAIERFSQYDRSGRGAGAQNPVVYAHRIVRLGGSSYHILSCTRDAGADYTGRTNQLAHHLICEPHELAQAPSPAEVLRQMAWRRTWTEEPRYFGAEDAVQLGSIPRSTSLPAKSWQALTGDAGCAALPLESGALSGCHWLYPADAGEQYLLPLFAESLLLLDPGGRNPDKLWQVPFTSYLQTTDHAADFFWRGCWQGSPAAATAQGARQTLDLTQPRNLRPPANPTAELARTGRAAAPEAAPPKNQAPVEMEYPAPAVYPGAQELDLSELLAEADKVDPTKRAGARAASKSASGRGDLGKSGTRKLPLKIILAAGVAIVVSIGLGIGFIVWRDGKAEDIRSELTKARNDHEFAKGRERVATISGLFLSYEPLKIEIERTLVAAELDDLKDKTPDEAGTYLMLHRQRLDAPSLQNDPAIKDRLDKIERWRKEGEKLVALNNNVRNESFSEPAAGSKIKKAFEDEEKAIAKLDKPYQPTIASALSEMKRLYVSRRLETLEQTLKGGTPPAQIEVIVAELLKDADRFATAPEVKSRIEQLYHPQPAPPSLPKPESIEKPPPEAAKLVKTGDAKDPFGLPEMVTYIAAGLPTGFDLSAVKEMQNGSLIPSGGAWLLLRAPEPALTAPHDAGEKLSISGKKCYDAKSAELFTLQQPQLAISPSARAALRESFLLRFMPAPVAGTDIQIFFQQSDQQAPALLRLPRQGGVVRTADNTVRIEPALAAKLQPIRPASATNAVLVLRCQPAGLNMLAAEATSFETLKLDLNVEMNRCRGDAAKIHAGIDPAEKKLKELKEVQAARDYILKTEELAYLGRTLFKDIKKREPMRKKNGDPDLDENGNQKYRFPPAMEKDNPLFSIDSYLTSLTGDPTKATLEDGETFAKYILALVQFVPDFVEDDDQRSKLRDVGLKIQENFRFQYPRAEKNRMLWQKLTTDLPTICSMKPANEKRLPTAETFYANWAAVFGEKHWAHIQPFLAWLGGDVTKPIQGLEKQLQPLRKELEKTDAIVKKLQGDPAGLAPFSIDIEFRGPPKQTVKLIEFLEPPPPAAPNPPPAAGPNPPPPAGANPPPPAEPK